VDKSSQRGEEGRIWEEELQLQGEQQQQEVGGE
jgi:hypothetical protein